MAQTRELYQALDTHFLILMNLLLVMVFMQDVLTEILKKTPVPEPLKTNASQSEMCSHDKYCITSTMVTALKHSHMIK